MPVSSSACKRSTSISSSSSSSPRAAGELQLLDSTTGQVITKRRIHANHEIIIGRDKTRCQWSFDDARLSAKHLRIYTVLYENGQDSRVDPLVYAEDLSRYGVYWNDSLIGKGTGGYLLSHEDKLRLSSTIILQFRRPNGDCNDVLFDITQEREMNGFRNEYVVTDRLLGAGVDGRVFMAIECASRSQVACKVVDLRRNTGEGIENPPGRPAAATEVNSRSQLYKVKVWAETYKKEVEYRFQRYSREVDILTSITHPNIISVDKVFATDNTIYIFQDLITAGDIFSYIEMKNHKLHESEAAVILRQITIALQFLHQKCIVHRDLKPDNIMVTSMAAGARIVLTDFGSARRVQSRFQWMRSSIGTTGYVAPEVQNLNPVMRSQLKVGYTTAVDMWSLGVVAILLTTGISAFPSSVTGPRSASTMSSLDLCELQKTSEWKSVRPKPKDFVSKLVVLDETTRMTADQALTHTWFSNDLHKVDFEDLYRRTIKDWHPRVAKIPVVTIQQGQKFKSSITNANGYRRNKMASPRPIEPPYIPFPRSMHTKFWPTRKPKQLMLEGVKAAIEDNWSTSGRVNQMNSSGTRFADLNDFYKRIEANDLTDLSLDQAEYVDRLKPRSQLAISINRASQFIVSENELLNMRLPDLALCPTGELMPSSLPGNCRKVPENTVQIESPSDPLPQKQEKLEHIPASASLGTLFNDSILGDCQTQKITVESDTGEGIEKPHLHNSVETDRNFSVSKTITTPCQHSGVIASSSPTIPNQPLRRLRSRSVVPKLRHLSNMSDTRVRKRRASIFDLQDDDSDSDEESKITISKKARAFIMFTNECADGDENIASTPNRMSAMLNIELEEPQTTWHIPR